MQTDAASWQTDPTGRHQYRWHDGSTWTDHVADDGQSATDRYMATDRPPNPPKEGWRGWPWWRWSLVIAALLLVLSLGFFAGAGSAYNDWDRRVSEIGMYDPYFELGYRAAGGTSARATQLAGRGGWSLFLSLTAGVAGVVGWQQERRRPSEARN